MTIETKFDKEISTKKNLHIFDLQSISRKKEIKYISILGLALILGGLLREATKTHGLLNPLTVQNLVLNPLTITGYIAILWTSWKILKLKQDQGEVRRVSNERHEFFSSTDICKYTVDEDGLKYSDNKINVEFKWEQIGGAILVKDTLLIGIKKPYSNWFALNKLETTGHQFENLIDIFEKRITIKRIEG